MADVIDLAARRPTGSGEFIQRPSSAQDAMFLGCAGCGFFHFGVVTRDAGRGRFVAALVCMACDPVRETAIVEGLLPRR